jgi:hypothetical protein
VDQFIQLADQRLLHLLFGMNRTLSVARVVEKVKVSSSK